MKENIIDSEHVGIKVKDFFLTGSFFFTNVENAATQITIFNKPMIKTSKFQNSLQI